MRPLAQRVGQRCGLAWYHTHTRSAPTPDQALPMVTPPLFCHKELCRHPPWPRLGSAAAARSALHDALARSGRKLMRFVMVYS